MSWFPRLPHGFLGELLLPLAAIMLLLALGAALSPTWVPLVYLASYLYHAINIGTFLLRHGRPEVFAVVSACCRWLALGTLVVVTLPHTQVANLVYAAPVLALGLVLHVASVRRLGWLRTYYGVELGRLRPDWKTGFPYNISSHPMAWGSGLQFVGIYLAGPGVQGDYPYLILGHVTLTLLNALLERFDLHLARHRCPPTQAADE